MQSGLFSFWRHSPSYGTSIVILWQIILVYNLFWSVSASGKSALDEILEDTTNGSFAITSTPVPCPSPFRSPPSLFKFNFLYLFKFWNRVGGEHEARSNGSFPCLFSSYLCPPPCFLFILSSFPSILFSIISSLAKRPRRSRFQLISSLSVYEAGRLLPRPPLHFNIFNFSSVLIISFS